MKPERYTITVTEKQAWTIRQALELVARANHVGANGHGQIAEDISRRAEQGQVMDACDFIFSWYAVDHQIAWDLMQVVRHRLAWDGLKPGEKRPITVDFDEPMKIGSEPLAKIERGP